MHEVRPNMDGELSDKASGTSPALHTQERRIKHEG